MSSPPKLVFVSKDALASGGWADTRMALPPSVRKDVREYKDAEELAGKMIERSKVPQVHGLSIAEAEEQAKNILRHYKGSSRVAYATTHSLIAEKHQLLIRLEEINAELCRRENNRAVFGSRTDGPRRAAIIVWRALRNALLFIHLARQGKRRKKRVYMY